MLKNIFPDDLKLKDFFVVNSFLLVLFINTISNYRPYTYYIKIGAGLLSIAIIYFERDFYKHFNLKVEKKLLTILSLFVFIPLISIFYSNNKVFGVEKLTHIIIGLLPLILFAYHLTVSFSKSRIDALFISIYSVSILMAVIILVFNPLIQNQVYRLKIDRWSHVLTGRFLTAFTVIIGFMLLKSKNKYFLIFNTLVLAILNYTIYFTAHRASTLGILIFYSLTIFYHLLKRTYSSHNFLAFVLTFVISVSAISILPPKTKPVMERYSNLFDKYDSNFGDDSPIFARLEAFRISQDIVKEYPILGVGFGGYKNTYNERTLGLSLEYPHNIFLEFLTEFGIVGLLLFLYFLFVYYKGLYFQGGEFVVFFTVMLWLACFSKDIPTQGMFWVGIVFLGIQNKNNN